MSACLVSAKLQKPYNTEHNPPLLQNDYNIEIMRRIEFEKVIGHLVGICNSLWDEGLILYPSAVKRLIGRATWTSKHERSNVGVLI